MIDRTEIEARARKLNLLPHHVANDYVLNHLLAAIADERAPVVFRGGTALSRAYWPDFRLSEDLDFISEARSSDLEGALRRAVAAAGGRTGLPLEVDVGRPAGGWSRSTVHWADDLIVVDLNLGERAYLPVGSPRLDLPYSDLAGEDRHIGTVALPEILANKWYMLDDRSEPRDLFDLWAGLCRFGVTFEEIAVGYRAKYGSSPGTWRLERALAMKADWEHRLAHQVGDLPSFEEAYGAVRARVAE